MNRDHLGTQIDQSKKLHVGVPGAKGDSTEALETTMAIMLLDLPLLSMPHAAAAGTNPLQRRHGRNKSAHLSTASTMINPVAIANARPFDYQVMMAHAEEVRESQAEQLARRVQAGTNAAAWRQTQGHASAHHSSKRRMNVLR
jgi:hypothetical protein